MQTMSTIPEGTMLHIRHVWANNLEHEFQLIREIVDDYPYLAMDTEFPGFVLEPNGDINNTDIVDYRYQTMKANVDMLKLIQVGLTFLDKDGNLPRCGTTDYCVWQFNFRDFNLHQDLHACDAIEMLLQSGTNFQVNAEWGIDSQRFRELLMSCGIMFSKKIHWVTFQGIYDFGYLLKLLTCQNLPKSRAEFYNLVETYFPMMYDIKYLMKFCNNLHGGLDRLAQSLDVLRVGHPHQAGSDSLLTGCTFQKLKERFLDGSLELHAGVLYGLEERSLNGCK